METLIFEDEHIEVYYWPRDDTRQTLIITFCDLGMPPGEGAWGKVPLSKINLPYVGFVSKRPNWFPLESIVLAEDIINSLTHSYKNIVTYGHSQGGYAALKYSKIFNATAAIAFCPQYSINPMDMDGRDLRFASFFSDKLQHQGIADDDVRPGTKAFIFYDPMDKLDKLNVGYILHAIPYAKTFKVLGTGHQSVIAVASSSGLRGIIGGVVTNDDFLIRGTILRCKREWASRAIFLARALSARRPKITARLIDLFTIEIHPEILTETITNLFRAGEHTCLVNNIDKLSKHADNNSRAQLLDASFIVDRLDLVVNYGGLWLRRHGKTDQNIAVRLSRAVAPTFQLLSLKKSASTTITYCEGWHSAEQWGRWGSSIRSRVIVNFPPFVHRPTQMLVLAETFLPDQTLKVCYYSNGSWHDAMKHDHRWSIPTNDDQITIDFIVDRLQSPDQAQLGQDTRFLGVKLSHGPQ